MSELIETLILLGQWTRALFTLNNGKILFALLVIVWIGRWVHRRTDIASRIKHLFMRTVGVKWQEFQTRREAAKAEQAKDWLNAGLSYQQVGEFEKALDCYENAGENHLAGELCLEMGHKEIAAEWFLESEEKLRAALLFDELGLHERAAEAYLKVGWSLDAASQFAEARNFVRAGELYERAGNLLRAGAAFEKARMFDRAGESFELQVSEFSSRGSYQSSGAEAELGRLSLRAGNCFAAAGDQQKAIALYEKGSQWLPAAELAEQGGEIRRAAQSYRNAGQIRKAAELFEKAGDRHEAARLTGDEKLSAGDALAAAEAYLAGGDLLHAAEVFQEAGEYVRAMECFETSNAYPQAADAAFRAGDKEKAAEFYALSHDTERAAEIFLEVGIFERASELFAESGRFYDAAKSAAEGNSQKKMVEYLQKVPPSDPNYNPAVAELSRVFTRKGWASLAREKLETVLSANEVVPSNLELWDCLAQAHEADGALERSVQILHRMMTVQYDYNGIDRRHAELVRRVEQEKEREQSIRTGSVQGMAETTDRYELKTMLGQGGIGSVYRAHDRLLKRPVAFKVLSSTMARDPAARDSLLNEARAAAALNHPNIVTVYDLGFDGQRTFICLELLEGEAYSTILKKRKGPLSLSEASHWMVSVCQGLDHAHSRGIVHRDLKPSNVMLSVDGQVKILDFGLAAPTEMSDESWAYSMSGTPKYIAPEAIRGQKPDLRVDIYSLGASLYELLVGRAPFTEGNLLLHHLHSPPPPLRAQRSEIPQPYEELVLTCLAKNPQDRFQSVPAILAFARKSGLI